MAGRERVVNFRIKAQDDYSAKIKAAEKGLRELTAAAQRNVRNAQQGIAVSAKERQEAEKLRLAYAALAAQMKQSYERRGSATAAGPQTQSFGVSSSGIQQQKTLQATLKETQAQYERNRLAVAALGRQMAQSSGPTEEMKADFDRARASLVALRGEMKVQEAQLARFRQASLGAASGFAAFSQKVAASNTVAGTRGGMWARLTAGINGSIQTQHGRGPLGLRPYELTNLGYQINDLATQVASGTSFTQAFAQQIGQIAQIFPKATLAIIRFTPQLALMAAAIAPAIGALSRLNETNTLLEGFSNRLAATVDGRNYDPRALVGLVRDLQNIGVAADDSRAGIEKMLGDNTSIERMRQFSAIAKDVSQTWGMEFGDALDAVRKGFSGTYDAVAELDDQFNFLTATQRENIRSLYEQGREAEATGEALKIYAQAQGDVAENMRGPWQQAALDLGNAWRALLDYIASTDAFRAATTAISTLSSAVASLISKLVSMDGIAGRVMSKALAVLTLSPALATASNLINAVRSQFDTPDPVTYGHRDDGLVAGSAPNPGQSQAEIKAKAEETRKLKEKLAEEENKALEKIFKEQGEALAKIDADNAERRFDATIATASELEQRTQRALREAEQNLASAGLSMDDKSREEIIETTRLLYEQEQIAKKLNKTKSGGGGNKAKTAQQLQDEKQKKLEEDLNILLERRAALMEQIEFHQERGESSQAEQLEGQIGGLNEQITGAIENLRTFWKAVGGEEAATALVKLDSVRNSLTEVGRQAVVTGEDINEMLADGGVDAFDSWAQSIAEGKNVIQGLRDAFLEFAADFLRQIAQMILQQALLNALQRGGGPGGGIGGVIAGAVGALFHSGGVVGRPGPSRTVPASIFAGATRLHSGGVAGLKSGEVPAILKKGEVVDPGDGSVFNEQFGGRGAVKIVNVLDPAEIATRGIASEAGQKAFLNFITGNSRKIKAALG